VKRSQRYKRLASGIKLLTDAVGGEVKAAVVAGALTVTGVAPVCAGSRRLPGAPPISLTPERQLGIIAASGVSLSAFNRIRRGIGGSRLGLASLPVLRAARLRLAGLPAKQVAVTASGAHLVSLKDAVKEKLDALWESNGFVERLLRDRDLKPIPQTEAYQVPAAGDIGSMAASPPANVKDVHMTLGLDKGGSPSSVKIVAGLANQRRPHRLTNTILVGVCPADKDKYDEVSAMLGEHLDQVAELVRDGIVVGGVRRAVRLMLSGDYEALCTVHGHKGPSATMPCLMCYSTRAPTATHAGLDLIFGTLQDVDVPSPTHPRTSAHLVEMASSRASGDPPGALIDGTSQATLRSIERPPLFTIDPRQIVPIPLHILLGITLRLLRLAMELIISCRGGAAGLAFAYGLAETLRCTVRVRPTHYHGGVFIGRDCHTIAEASDAVCRTLLGLVPERDHVAYKRLWFLWKGLARTMSRAAEVDAAEARAFRANALLFVRHMKRSFPWVNISPKLHMLMYHAPDFLDRFGSIGLYGEQSIEAWHGFYTQNSAKYAAGTEVEACANLVRVMAVAREANNTHLSSDTRRSAKVGARRARRSGDRRKRENKAGSVECRATREKAIREGRKWARKVFKVGDRTFETFLTRLASGGE